MIDSIFLTWIPVAMAFVSLAIGVGALIAPHASSIMYGAPTRDAGFVKASGIRDFFITLVILELLRQGQTRLMAESFYALAIVSLGDAYVTWTSGNKKRTPAHLAGAAAAAAYATIVLWFFI